MPRWPSKDQHLAICSGTRVSADPPTVPADARVHGVCRVRILEEKAEFSISGRATGIRE